MFTWICPTCGREVPPSYDECPDCAGKAKAAGDAAPPAQAEPAAPAPVPVQPPQPKAPPPVRRGLPTWFLSVLFALAFIGLGAGVYWGVQYLRHRSEAGRQALAMENVPAAGKPKPHPMQRYIEVTGIRFLQDRKKQTEVRFLVVNHSPDEIAELAGNVTIWGRTQRSDEEPVGTFSFKIPSIQAWEYKEFSAPMNTKLRVYELPDWQNVTAELQLTSP